LQKSHRVQPDGVSSTIAVAIATIEETLDQVAQDHRTRALKLEGDQGSGNTYLLVSSR
jgi:hypothetical protein